MEDLSLNRNDKYGKVEHKLEMLAQSKLQNLNASTLRRVEDRILALEKGVCESAASNEKIGKQSPTQSESTAFSSGRTRNSGTSCRRGLSRPPMNAPARSQN